MDEGDYGHHTAEKRDKGQNARPQGTERTTRRNRHGVRVWTLTSR